MKNDIELNKKIGSRLKSCRTEKKLTQADLAEASNLSVQHISYIENGKRNLTLEVARVFSDILNVQEDYLLYETDCPTKLDEKIKENKLLDARDSAFTEYLRSIGFDPIFEFGQLDSLNEYWDYLEKNNYPVENDTKITFRGYSNDLNIHFYGKDFIAPNAKIIFCSDKSKASFDVMEFLDLMDDIKDYTTMLINKKIARKHRSTSSTSTNSLNNE